jgi:putative mRNA 3-end processing factor
VSLAAPDDLLVPTAEGLYCPAGGFHVDPWRPVERAIITHAHSDHAAPGSSSYLASTTGAVVLRERLGSAAAISTLGFGQRESIGDVEISMHPAGHILGSAQVRVQHRGRVWVVGGDHKTAHDRTCEPFEPVRCNVFISESTFGLPIYRWKPQSEVFAEINEWWLHNQAAGRTSIIYAYALGKAQRVLGGVDPGIGPIAVHGAVERMNRAYAAAGVRLPEAPNASGEQVPRLRGRGLVVAPPSAAGTPWLRKLVGPEGLSTAFVSGWMQVRGARRRRSVDRGFVLSDHADWPGLLETIAATGASRVGVTHGYIQPLVRYLRDHLRLDAFGIATRFEGERGEDDPASADSTPSELPHPTELP